MSVFVAWFIGSVVLIGLIVGFWMLSQLHLFLLNALVFIVMLVATVLEVGEMVRWRLFIRTVSRYPSYKEAPNNRPLPTRKDISGQH